MVPVAVNHGLYIPVMPLLEIIGVIIGAFGFLPLIEGFVDHQHSKLVTGIQKVSGWRIVAGADGIVAILLHPLYPAVLSIRKGSSTKQTIVMMHAGSFHQNFLSVQQESILCTVSNGPDTECGLITVCLLSIAVKR